MHMGVIISVWNKNVLHSPYRCKIYKSFGGIFCKLKRCLSSYKNYSFFRPKNKSKTKNGREITQLIVCMQLVPRFFLPMTLSLCRDVSAQICWGPQFSRWLKAKQWKSDRAEKSLESLSQGLLTTRHLPACLNLYQFTPRWHKSKHRKERFLAKSFRSGLWALVEVDLHSGVGGCRRAGSVYSFLAPASSRPFPQLHTRQCQTHEAFRILTNPRLFCNLKISVQNLVSPGKWQGGWHVLVDWQSSYHWVHCWQGCCQSCCNAGNRKQKASRAGWCA